MTNLSLIAANRLVSTALVASSTSSSNAESVASAIVAAEAAGRSEHGLARVPGFCRQSQAGRIDGFAVPSLAQSAPGSLIVDAGDGFASPALDLAISELLSLVRSQGVAMAGIRHSHDFGDLGHGVSRLAEAGLAGIAFANCPDDPEGTGERGAGSARHPLAFAAPAAGEPLDIIIVDRLESPGMEGQVPLSLAVVADLLAGGLTGARFGHEAAAFDRIEDPPPGVGMLLIGLSPGAFGGTVVLHRFAELAGRLRTGAAGQAPGDNRAAARATANERGIEVDAALVEELESLAGPAS